MNRIVRNALAAAGFVAATLASNVALAVAETETTPGANDSLGAAQPIAGDQFVAGSVMVNGAIGSTTYSVPAVPDVDFYSFEATGNDVLTIDINGGIKDGGLSNPIRSVDTIIALFMPDGTMLYSNDDADDIDIGSVATNDSRIVSALIPSTGTYIVGVSSTGQTMATSRFFIDGGALSSSALDQNTGNGSYTLTISGVNPPPPAPTDTTGGTPPTDTTGGTPPTDTTGGTPPTGPGPVVGGVKQVSIDIRPRHPGVTKIWANSDGKIAVALLSSDTFNALKVDRTSITFGADGNEASLIRCHSEGVYVNRDRRKDLVCLFDLKKASFDVGDLEGVVRGRVEGQPFEGHAPVKVYQLGKKHKHRHWERHADRR